MLFGLRRSSRRHSVFYSRYFISQPIYRIWLSQHHGRSQSGSQRHHPHCGNQCVRDKKKWQLAFGLLRTMAGAKVEANNSSYNAAISAYEKGKEWQLAFGLLSTMAGVPMEAKTISYTAAIRACEKGQEWQLAFGLPSTMARAKRKAETSSYIATISACVKGQEWQLALGSLNTLRLTIRMKFCWQHRVWLLLSSRPQLIAPLTRT